MSVLVVGEYWKRFPGLAYLAIILAEFGLIVHFSVIEATEEEERDADQHGVSLVLPIEDTKDKEKDWIFDMFDTFYPTLADCDIRTIIGHYNDEECTGKYANLIFKRDFFPGARLFGFIDDLPEKNDARSWTKKCEKIICVGRCVRKKIKFLSNVDPFFVIDWCIPSLYFKEYFKDPIKEPNYSSEDPFKIASLVLDTSDLDYIDRTSQVIKESASAFFKNLKRKTVWKLYIHHQDINIDKYAKILKSQSPHLEIEVKHINSNESDRFMDPNNNEALIDIKRWGVSLVIFFKSRSEQLPRHFLFWLCLATSGVPACVSEITDAGYLIREKYNYFVKDYDKEEFYEIKRMLHNKEKSFEKARELRLYLQSDDVNKGLATLVDLCRSNEDNLDNLQIEKFSKIGEPIHKIKLQFNGKDKTIFWRPRSVRWHDKIKKMLSNPEISKLKLVNKVYYSFEEEFLIAEGSNSTLVYLGFTVEGKEIVIKITRKIKNEQLLIDEEKINNVMWKKYSQKFVKLHCSGSLGDLDSYICLDLCEYGLDEFIKSDKYNEDRAKELCRQFLDGLQCLHSANYMHRDLKPQNVLITATGDLKIADFGLTRQMEPEHSTKKTAAGTRSWRPTEAFFEGDPKKYYTKASDIQVAGMLLYYILTGGYHPYGGLNSDILYMENCIKDGKFELDKLQDDKARKLIERMLHKNPVERPKIEEVLGDEYFDDVSEENLKSGDPSKSSDDFPNHVMFLIDEWGSSKGGIATFNRELALHLTKVVNTQCTRVSCMLTDVKPQDRAEAEANNIILYEAPGCPGMPFNGRFLPAVMDLPPSNQPDVIVGHSLVTGPAAKQIQDKLKCVRVHFLHMNAEELSINKLGPGELDKGLEKHQTELELCEGELTVVAAVGPRLRDDYQTELRVPGKRKEVVYEFVPGLFEKLTILPPPSNIRVERARVFMICRCKEEDFKVKGMDLAAKAVAAYRKDYRKDVSLTLVGAPPGKIEETRGWFEKETTIPAGNLFIHPYADIDKVHNSLFKADLLLMPSRVEGFGLIALEAISALLPVLMSDNSGLAMALKKVHIGGNSSVDSDHPNEWARAMNDVFDKPRERRTKEAVRLREDYDENYTWEKAWEGLLKCIKKEQSGK